VTNSASAEARGEADHEQDRRWGTATAGRCGHGRIDERQVYSLSKSAMALSFKCQPSTLVSPDIQNTAAGIPERQTRAPHRNKSIVIERDARGADGVLEWWLWANGTSVMKHLRGSKKTSVTDPSHEACEVGNDRSVHRLRQQPWRPFQVAPCESFAMAAAPPASFRT
jgi:hypothetical protein